MLSRFPSFLLLLITLSGPVIAQPTMYGEFWESVDQTLMTAPVVYTRPLTPSYVARVAMEAAFGVGVSTGSTVGGYFAIGEISNILPNADTGNYLLDRASAMSGMILLPVCIAAWCGVSAIPAFLAYRHLRESFGHSRIVNAPPSSHSTHGLIQELHLPVAQNLTDRVRIYETLIHELSFRIRTLISRLDRASLRLQSHTYTETEMREADNLVRLYALIQILWEHYLPDWKSPFERASVQRTFGQIKNAALPPHFHSVMRDIERGVGRQLLLRNEIPGPRFCRTHVSLLGLASDTQTAARPSSNVLHAHR